MCALNEYFNSDFVKEMGIVANSSIAKIFAKKFDSSSNFYRRIGINRMVESKKEADVLSHSIVNELVRKNLLCKNSKKKIIRAVFR